MSVTTDLAKAPGAMEHRLERPHAKGLIEFEEAPAGWLTKTGTPRKEPWRAYYFSPRGPESQRTRLPSTTTLLNAICPKDGLPRWAEGKGIEGAWELCWQFDNALHKMTDDASKVVQWVRERELGADAAKLRAAQRGLNVHDLLREYMETGKAPIIGAHPEEHRGYIQALCKWLIKCNPEPVAVEQLVVHGEHGYAGRLDLRAKIAGRLTTVDLKTQERAGIYRAAHWQVNLYEEAATWLGDEPAEQLTVVVVAADGEYREMPVDRLPVEQAIDFYRICKPIDSACERENKREREARA
jgi:hypothetical protein